MKKENNASDGGGQFTVITITGLSGKKGYCTLKIRNSGGAYVAMSDKKKKISGDIVTFSLPEYTNASPDPWTGTGAYVLILIIESKKDGGNYYFTDGKTKEELGINESASRGQFEKLPLFNIGSEESTIDFGEFIKVSIF